MSELIRKIKDSAHRVSEDYLLMNKNMNESLEDLIKEGSVENEEILKRICEHSNQNVYLSLYNDPDVDSSNILFEVADFSKVAHILKESEQAMNDYNTPPEDFRKGLDVVIMYISNNSSNSGNEKLAELNELVQYRDVLTAFVSKIEMMKTAEVNNAEQAFNEMANDAKTMVANGSSLGDISKIASRFVKENIGGDFMKIAQCYNLINDELIKSNFSVSTTFTKLSSQRINPGSRMLAPVKDFSDSITKIAGLEEMENSVRERLAVFNKTIKENYIA